MQNKVFPVNLHLKDLNPLHFGWKACEPGFSLGPTIRSYTLLHFVISGKGTLYTRGGCYTVHAGEAFLILPDEAATYCADMDDPWEYQYIAFDGELARDFQKLPPVFPVSEHNYRLLTPPKSRDQVRPYILAAGLFYLYQELLGENVRQKDYVQSVREYISVMYSEELTVEQIANSFNLNRRYLSRRFKEETGYTIQEQIIQERIRAGRKLLEQGYSVQAAAQLSGYRDVSNFSKMFKAKTGVSPILWRKNAEKNQSAVQTDVVPD